MRGLILASSSPRRRALLASAGLTFAVEPSSVDEGVLPGEAAADYVRRIAAAKASEVAGRWRADGDSRPVLGADTAVVVEGRILGKPADRDEARRFLAQLSGREHEVITGFCILLADDRRHHAEVVTKVRFKVLHPAEVEAYLDTGEWRDKAGAYAVQGNAAYMVESLSGSYTNVVGLPLCEVVEALRQVSAAEVVR